MRGSIFSRNRETLTSMNHRPGKWKDPSLATVFPRLSRVFELWSRGFTCAIPRLNNPKGSRPFDLVHWAEGTGIHHQSAPSVFTGSMARLMREHELNQDPAIGDCFIRQSHFTAFRRRGLRFWSFHSERFLLMRHHGK